MIVVYGQATASLGHWFGVAYVELDLGRNPRDLFEVATRALEVAGLEHSDRDLFHVVLCEPGAAAPRLFDSLPSLPGGQGSHFSSLISD